MRLDVYLAEVGLARSRTHAQNLIKLGRVAIGGETAEKASLEVDYGVHIDISEEDDFASLGGVKLRKALDFFKISAENKVCIDIGASNGGFTDVLLRAGAAKVYAVDIGACALPAELAEDERVVVKERLNARYLAFEDLGIVADLITVDVSFISLKMILPALIQFLADGSLIIALIKPQFEVGKGNLTKTGVVKTPKLAAKAVESVTAYSRGLGLRVLGITEAPHPFENKNKEFLLLLTK